MKKFFAKAIEVNSDFLPTGKFSIIELNEKEYEKHRIVEELAAMSLETCPMLNPKKENKGVPYVFWDSEDFNNEDNDKISELCEKRSKEFDAILIEKLKTKLNITLKEGEYIYIGDGFNPKEDDEKENIVSVFMYELCTKKQEDKIYTVNDLIKELQSLPESMKNADVNIMFEDEDGNGSGYPVSFVSHYESDGEDDELPSCVDLTYSDYNEEKGKRDRIQNIEDMHSPKETYTTKIGEVKVYKWGERIVHILTCYYGKEKNIIKEIVNGEEI